APWETLPGDVVRIILAMLVNEKERAERRRLRDFVAFKNTCRAFRRAAAKMPETVEEQDAMRHHALYKVHNEVEKELREREMRRWERANRAADCAWCCSNFCGCMAQVFCCCCGGK